MRKEESITVLGHLFQSTFLRRRLAWIHIHTIRQGWQLNSACVSSCHRYIFSFYSPLVDGRARIYRFSYLSTSLWRCIACIDKKHRVATLHQVQISCHQCLSTFLYVFSGWERNIMSHSYCLSASLVTMATFPLSFLYHVFLIC